jgi:hypothetical protein
MQYRGSFAISIAISFIFFSFHISSLSTNRHSSYAAYMKSAATSNKPFEALEVERAVEALRQLATKDSGYIDWQKYEELIRSHAHKTHKNWEQTEQFSNVLSEIFGSPNDLAFQTIFKRVLKDGKWREAEKSRAVKPPSEKPWIVLVSGLNGIRKTTCLYQTWFQCALNQALMNPKDSVPFSYTFHDLPWGGNSFFRQLDYMIATVANHEFSKLYTISDVSQYAFLKDAIFARYRCLAEMLGILLIREGKNKKLNIMLETSGRDIAMFEYVNKFFTDEDYYKLVLHFSINDIEFAKRSVDRRMINEMKDGAESLKIFDTDPSALIQANAGGPYGSLQLDEVKQASDTVWSQIINDDVDIAKSWFKASFTIEASDDREWLCGTGVETFPITRLN